MEEFQDLLEPDLVSLLKESMYNATVGDGYRNGGINGDNCQFSVRDLNNITQHDAHDLQCILSTAILGTRSGVVFDR
jgi:hypothetical protein